jgi:cell division protein FtsB
MAQLKHELQRAYSDQDELRRQIDMLNDRLVTRDTEIKRLQVTSTQSAGAIKSTLDSRQAHEAIGTQQKKIEFLHQQNQELIAELNEIKDLVGIAESKDPTDKDRFHLKKVIRSLKQRNDTLYDENRQLGEVIDSLKRGKFNETEGAKLIMDEQYQQLNFDLTEARTQLETLKKENRALRTDADRAQQYQSAF